MLLRIQYNNDKYDYVDQRTLDGLIIQKAINQFYRPQEKKWVNLDRDSIRRGWGGDSIFYIGVERRK